MKPTFLVAMTAGMLLIAACSADPEPQRPTPPAAMEKNLFQELKERTASDPRNTDAWFHLADLYEREGLFKEEADALLKVVALDPKNGYAHMKLGNAYGRLGLHEKAIASYRRAAPLIPGNPVLYNNLAVALGRTGRNDEEIMALKKAIALRPRYATARFNLGMVFLKKGDRALALEQYRELDRFDANTAASLKKEIESQVTRK